MFYLFQLARLSMSWLPGTASLYSFSPPRCICDLPVCDIVPWGLAAHTGVWAKFQEMFPQLVNGILFPGLRYYSGYTKKSLMRSAA